MKHVTDTSIGCKAHEVCLYSHVRAHETAPKWRRRVRRDPQTKMYRLEEQRQDDEAFQSVVSFDNALSAVRSLMAFHPHAKNVMLYVNEAFVGTFHLDTWAADAMDHVLPPDGP